jgi:hypothetical protein
MFRMALGAVAAIAAAVVTAVPASSAPSSSPSCPRPPALPAPDEFRGPTGAPNPIDNPYLPLAPGTVLTYKGKLDGKSATDVFTVTDQTKVILGVTTTVIHDQVFQGGDLVEDTFDWFAQDADGNVWYFGEDTKELDHGEVVSTEGSWEAGVDHARAGIFMPADPMAGDVNKQEDAKDVAEDCAQIVDLHAFVKTPFITTNNALKTEEFSLLEPEVIDNKFYVQGIGLVAERGFQNSTDFLNLVSVKH